MIEIRVQEEKCLLKQIDNFRKKWGYDPFYNNRYREDIIHYEIMKYYWLKRRGCYFTS